jgi:hypothetical protein
MNLLVPCAGRSSRYETRLPKYLLSMPDGRLMFELAVEPFRARAGRVLFAVLREHDEGFHAGDVIREVLPQAEVMVIGEVTRGQAETVELMVEHFGVDGAFLAKDSDSYFVPTSAYDPRWNYVSVCSARKERGVKLYNKSFADINELGYVVGMLEKEISSEFFSCGGYFFSDPGEFADAFRHYEKITTGGGFYLSEIIDLVIEAGGIFHPMQCEGYLDWGTHDDWIAYRQSVATYVLDLDGVVYRNGSRFWNPRWGENEVIPRVGDKVNELFDRGNYIVLMTSRPESFRPATEAQLDRDGVRYHQLVMGVHHGRRVLVNDFSGTNPYPSAVAINTPRDSGDAVDMLDGGAPRPPVDLPTPDPERIDAS